MTTKTFPERLALCKIEDWDHITAQMHFGDGYPNIPVWNEVPFFRGQKKIVLRNCGLINPDDVEEYIAIGGYQSLYKVLIDGTPELANEQLKISRLRGRGGAGFSTGLKWEFMRKAEAEHKYLICNADEGDPGAYMNRNELEGDPHSLIEGMAIGGDITGAKQGIIYVRAEYPLAVHRLKVALAQAKNYGVIGDDILGRGFKFDIDLVEGAGAFVCGEETALISSLEDARPAAAAPAVPRPKRPVGLSDQHQQRRDLVQHRPDRRQRAGLVHRDRQRRERRNQGVFAGRQSEEHRPGRDAVRHAAVELRLRRRLRQHARPSGQGGADRRPVRRLHPARVVRHAGRLRIARQARLDHGLGGMVVMDDDNCMVDVARYFVEFTRSESCGKCTPCRVGLDKALRTLTRITKGEGREEDLAELDGLGRMIRDTALCGLGQTAPNSILTTLRRFHDEFEDHIKAKRCRAGVCQDLALSPCENSCPLHMNIPRFLQLYKEGRLDDAFESVIMDNPLPASTGRVCQHPCDDRCRRQTVDEAVNMRDVHRLIADAVLLSDKFDEMVERIVAKRRPPTGRKVAVAGAGPPA